MPPVIAICGIVVVGIEEIGTLKEQRLDIVKTVFHVIALQNF